VAQWLHDRACRYEALLVGKPESTPILQCLHRDWKTSKADDAVNDDISNAAHLSGIRYDLNAILSSKGITDLFPSYLITHRDNCWAKLQRLLDDEVNR
jgi:hypothetical protein